MTFGEYFKQGIELIKLNGDTAKKLAADEKAFLTAILFIVIGGLASAIGSLNLGALVAGPIAIIVMYFIIVGVFHLLAKLFGGKGTYMGLFRAMGIASILGWVTVVPIIGPILSPLVLIWSIVMDVVIIKNVHELSTGKAVWVVIIPLVIIGIIMIALAAVLIGFVMSMMGLSSMAI